METHSSSSSSMYDAKMMPKQEYGVDFESFTQQIDCPLLDYDYFRSVLLVFIVMFFFFFFFFSKCFSGLLLFWNSGYSEYSLWDYHCGFSMQESPFEASPAAASAMETPLYSSMDIEQSSHNIVQGNIFIHTHTSIHTYIHIHLCVYKHIFGNTKRH